VKLRTVSERHYNYTHAQLTARNTHATRRSTITTYKYYFQY